MTAIIDIISPSYLFDEAINIEVDSSSQPLLNYRPIRVNFNYDDAEEFGGVSLPLIVSIQAAHQDNGLTGFKQKFFERAVPSSYIFTVASAGAYLVTIREFAHNKLQGRLTIEVGGDAVPSISPRERLL